MSQTKNIKQRGLWKREDMAKAIDLYNLNKQLSAENRLPLREIARECGIPFETLRRRVMGLVKSIKPAHGRKPILSGTEENELVDMIKEHGDAGFPLNKREICQRANVYCKKKQETVSCRIAGGNNEICYYLKFNEMGCLC